MTGTEQLNMYLAKSIERRLKPKRMSSQIFWELHKLLKEQN